MYKLICFLNSQKNLYRIVKNPLKLPKRKDYTEKLNAKTIKPIKKPIKTSTNKNTKTQKTLPMTNITIDLKYIAAE